MHLNRDELIDLAEGTRPEASSPHLAGCDPCRRQVEDLRAMMSAVLSGSDADVPEPSPLFWDRLSERVKRAVLAPELTRRSWPDAALWRRLLMPLSVLAVASLLIAIVLNAPGTPPHLPARGGGPAHVARAAIAVDSRGSADMFGDSASGEDVSLTLVADLTDYLDLDAAGEAGLASLGSAERAVTHMSDDDLRELRRVLQEELARSGA